ncbi:arsenate reductase/protein-tyrosine-phosphatase family protein [Pseudooceanicola sp.]|uniref:arsenate reductase/protein-tyrosine-phosphatase family protein n=1 Tax=Pseudooceanicola sp. TaxID=1914328 RepID=UPI00405A1DF6
MNILILCPDNATLSILLETLLNDLGAGRIAACSAGPAPAGAVHPQALKLLEEEDLDTSRAAPKPVDEFTGPDAVEIDLLITLGPVTPPRLAICGDPARGHWQMTDPATLPEDAWDEGFRRVYDMLRERAKRLLEHPVETMDSGELTALLTRLGRG